MPKEKQTIIIALVVVLATIVVLYVAGSKKGTEPKAAEPQASQSTSQLPAGLKVETLQQGTGDRTAQNGDTLSMRYVGTFEDGTTFDSNIAAQEPFAFTLGAGEVIKGWDLGLVGMKVGEKRKLVIGPDLGYGSRARGPIPANSTLVFDVQLVDIK